MNNATPAAETESTRHDCSPACYNATTSQCLCICHGRNHGAGFANAILRKLLDVHNWLHCQPPADETGEHVFQNAMPLLHELINHVTEIIVSHEEKTPPTTDR